jgi:hypothetical protein
MKKLLSFSLSVLLMTALGSCTQEANTTQQEGQPETSAAVVSDSTAANAPQMAYVCPMKCEGSASMSPGKCPVCKMNLEKNPNHTAPDSTQQH